MSKAVRLDKFLADSGRGTRSEVKKYIQKGLVQVNDMTVKKPEQKIDPERDSVLLKGERVEAEPEFVYYLLHKPAGCVSATEDRNDRTVMDYVPSAVKVFFPWGDWIRIQKALLLITNDGMLAHELLSPARHVEKTYFLRAEGIVTEDDRIRLERGVDIGEEKPTLPARAEILKRTGGDSGDPGPGCTELLLSICEGKFHQVKRMMEAVGKPVIYLKRVSMGPLTLPEDLKKGECRPLTEQEVTELKQAGKK